jgi:hypothetical protein
MKNALVCALMSAVPLAAMAQSPILTVLNDGAPPATDVALAMMSGFVDCDAAATLPPALTDSGVRFAQPGAYAAPPGSPGGLQMVLEPDRVDPAHLRRDPRGGVRYASAAYRLSPLVAWPAAIEVREVAQTVDAGAEPGHRAGESVTLTFNVSASVVRAELDRRYDGRVSARLGAGHRRERVWFDQPAANALRCLRQPGP